MPKKAPKDKSVDPAAVEAVPEADDEETRRRAYELALERPNATPEENWLLAEAQLHRDAAEKRDADRKAAEDEANLMARIEMDVLGHP